MKFSEAWLREWVNPSLSREALCERLTMTGLEVDGIEPVAEYFSAVVIGKILRFQKHPEAAQLQICEVSVGQETVLIIVTAAPNVKVGMKTPVALINAVLPNNRSIKETVLRGVSSQGLLCSAFDLGLAEGSEGLLELQNEAPEGVDFWEYLNLSDYVIDVAITPNRGDCLSIKGMAREVGAITQTALQKIPMPAAKPRIDDGFPVKIEDKEACPRYVGRVMRGVKADAKTPVWMQERLRRGGIRCVSPIVDVTNYVMLELGQPMHAFDLSRLGKQIVVRRARKNEALMLLDGSTLKLDEKDLIIADQTKPLALAGVMGGLDSGINLLTEDLFLESAFFKPTVVAQQRQAHQLNSESAYRFERGVDPDLQVFALERATQLLMKIVGGKPGPVLDFQEGLQVLPLQETRKEATINTITLSTDYLHSLLGAVSISDKAIKDIFKRLGFGCKKEKTLWQVQVPSWRFDVKEEVDLIEELARLYGYDKIVPSKPSFAIQTQVLPETQLGLPRLRRFLCDSGFHEVISYSFVSQELQATFDPERKPKKLVNPITAEMTVMRSNLWPGLMGCYLYNRDRQQPRGRFFETGLCFVEQAQRLLQIPLLGGLISGQALPEQWGQGPRESDFFDLKGEVERMLQLTHHKPDAFHFKPIVHPALHPGQSACLYRQEEALGVLGALHPALRQKFDILEPIFLFEFNLDSLLAAPSLSYSEISKFPEIRRDLALLVDRQLSSAEIQATIVKSGGEWLRHVSLFDVYLGEGVPKDKKSVAFALTLQHATRTLRDEEVVETMERIIRALQQTWGIELRG